jgi:ABC-type multidrug transport system ATPase subunit
MHGHPQTTFLDVLAGRITGTSTGSADALGPVRGSVAVDGRVTTAAERRCRFGYVRQDETLIGVLTVRETLAFAADMDGIVNPTDTHTQKTTTMSRVNLVMEQLGLSHVADSRVGGGGGFRGLSGGERRRVAIGVALVTRPRVLLLDEPTTGLDAASAMQVMSVLTRLVSPDATAKTLPPLPSLGSPGAATADGVSALTSSVPLPNGKPPPPVEAGFR